MDHFVLGSTMPPAFLILLAPSKPQGFSEGCHDSTMVLGSENVP
jgi:hypothetical protein